MNASIVVSGLTIGSVYALIAVGINILYRPTKVFNFAQGCLAMLGSMIGLSAFDAGLKWWAVPPLIFVAVGVISLIEDQVAVAPVLAREPNSFTWLITTLGFSIVVQETAGHIWDSGPNLVNPPSFLPIREHNFGWVQVSAYQVGVAQVRVTEIGFIKAGLVKVGFIKVGVRGVGFVEVCLVKAGVGEVGAGEVGFRADEVPFGESPMLG